MSVAIIGRTGLFRCLRICRSRRAAGGFTERQPHADPLQYLPDEGLAVLAEFFDERRPAGCMSAGLELFGRVVHGPNPVAAFGVARDGTDGLYECGHVIDRPAAAQEPAGQGECRVVPRMLSPVATEQGSSSNPCDSTLQARPIDPRWFVADGPDALLGFRTPSRRSTG